MPNHKTKGFLVNPGHWWNQKDSEGHRFAKNADGIEIFPSDLKLLSILDLQAERKWNGQLHSVIRIHRINWPLFTCKKLTCVCWTALHYS